MKESDTMRFQTKHLFPIFALALLANFVSCATVKELPKPDTTVVTSENAPKKVGDDLLKAFLNNDSKTFLGLLPDVVSEEFGENGFKETRKDMLENLGKPLSYTYMGNLEHPRFTVSLWKIRFERKSTDGTKVIHQEAMFRAVSGVADKEDQERLLSFNFF